MLLTSIDNLFLVRPYTYAATISRFDSNNPTQAFSPMDDVFYIDCGNINSRIQPLTYSRTIEVESGGDIVEQDKETWGFYLPAESLSVNKSDSFYKEALPFHDPFKLSKTRRVYDSATYYTLEASGQFWVPLNSSHLPASGALTDWLGGFELFTVLRDAWYRWHASTLENAQQYPGFIAGSVILEVIPSKGILPARFWVIKRISISISEDGQAKWEISLESINSLAAISAQQSWPGINESNVAYRNALNRDFKIYCDYSIASDPTVVVNGIMTSFKMDFNMTWSRISTNWSFMRYQNKDNYASHKHIAATESKTTIDMSFIMAAGSNHADYLHGYNSLLGNRAPYSQNLILYPYEQTAVPVVEGGLSYIIWDGKNISRPADDIVKADMQGIFMVKTEADTPLNLYL